jgi:hypothetical protein
MAKPRVALLIRKGVEVGAGISLVVIGAILAFAVRTDASAVDLQVVGLIFMVAGGAVIAYYRQERHQKQVVTHVEHIGGEAHPEETVHRSVTHEIIYEGDEVPPPPTHRPATGHDGL